MHARLYCLVDPRAAGRLLRPVRDHFARAPEVTVLVERRGRGGAARPGARRAPVAERDAGRRLPAELRDEAGGLRLVQPLTPIRRVHEDTDIADLIAKTIALDPEATSELWWRIAPRVLTRLELGIWQVPDPAAALAVFGRILDELPDYEPSRQRLPAWLDAVVDDYAQERLAAAAAASAQAARQRRGSLAAQPAFEP